MTRTGRILAALCAVLAVPSLAVAALKDAGPVGGYGPGTSYGFPAWYRDTSGNAVQLCTEDGPATGGGTGGHGTTTFVSPNASAAGAPMCFPLVNDPAGYQAPANIGGEIFYYNASTSLAGANGFSLLWEGALEATYANGTPVQGDEITFTRIRIVMDTNVAGDYTVIHPYGQEVFPGVKGGKRAVFFTVDIGVAPGIFTGALAGGVGPFLEWDQNVANPTALFGFDPLSGAALQLSLTNPTNGNVLQFVGDPNMTHTVTGSPFLQNFVKVIGPPGSNLDGAGGNVLQTNLFAVLGQRYTAPIPQPLVVYRANKMVDPFGYTTVDVFVESTPGASLISTAKNVPTAKLFVDQATGEGYSHVEFLNSLGLATGPTAFVTNVLDVPPSSASAPLADVVSTSLAVMTPDPTGLTTGDLVITAESSVQHPDAAGAYPIMAIAELPGAAVTPDPTRPWIQTFSATLPAGVTPPWHLTVISNQGGSHAEPVILAATGFATPAGPVAPDLAAATAEDVAVVISDPSFLLPNVSIVLIGPPANGTAVVGAGQITYTPALHWFSPGVPPQPDTFTYILVDATNPLAPVYSNLGTAAVTVTAVNNPPTAAADSASTTVNTAVTINVAGNDTDIDLATLPGGLVVPSSVVITTLPASGTVVNNGNGSVTFTPALNFTGTVTFQYTIADNGVPPATSAPGTVTVTVAAPEQLFISRAEWTVKSGRYRALGTSSVFGIGLTNTVTIRAGTHAAPGVLIGSAAIDATGAWLVDITNLSLVIPCTAGQCPATISSTGGGFRDFSYAQK